MKEQIYVVSDCFDIKFDPIFVYFSVFLSVPFLICQSHRMPPRDYIVLVSRGLDPGPVVYNFQKN